jgi:hypothetical protein
MAEHAEIAGELVGDGQSLEPRCFGEDAGGGFGRCAVEEIETLAKGGEMAPPEIGEEGFDFYVFSVVFFSHCGCRSDERGEGEVARAVSLVFPAEDVGDLLGEGERIEGFEEDAGQAESGEAPLVDSLYLGGEQENRDV